jgi:hypothetical protein
VSGGGKLGTCQSLWDITADGGLLQIGLKETALPLRPSQVLDGHSHVQHRLDSHAKVIVNPVGAKHWLGENRGPGGRETRSETGVDPTLGWSGFRGVPFVETANVFWSVLEVRGRLPRRMVVSDPTNEILQGAAATEVASLEPPRCGRNLLERDSVGPSDP